MDGLPRRPGGNRLIAVASGARKVIAVEPARQGRGIGSRLLQAAGTRADTDGMPIVLLTYQPKSLPLYQRHGYTVVCEGAVAGSEVRGWGMRRNPGT